MRKRSTKATPFQSIEGARLASVTGGKFSPRTTLDPVLLQGFQSLSQAIGTIGQNLAAAKQSSTQQIMQAVQGKMDKKKGHKDA